MSSDLPKLLLQYLHSVLIDELSERIPSESLVLAMPQRSPGLSLPSLRDTKADFVFVRHINGPGDASFLICLAIDRQCCGRLQPLVPEELWKAVMIRLEKECRIRSVEVIMGADYDADRIPAARLSVWLPICIGDGTCWAGTAIV